MMTRREGFSMFVAIATIIVMAALTALVMSLTGKITKETTDQYRREQAILYAKSYTELAIMAAGANDCLEGFKANTTGSYATVKKGQGYRVLVNIKHIGGDTACPTASQLDSGTNILYAPSRGSSILVDVRVMYKDLDEVDAVLSAGGTITASSPPWRTYFRRTIQRL